MSYRELFLSPRNVFAGFQQTFHEAQYLVLGVPFDGTSTHRPGARFAPSAIREASLDLETYSFRAGVDLLDLKLHDLGDLHITGDASETLKRLEFVVNELTKEKKLPICIGGEHTLALGMVRGVGEKCAVLSFDAHLDLRNEYLGRNISHATFMRRLSEQVGPEKILEIGVRAVCKEELDYAREFNVQFITAHQIREESIDKTVGAVKKFLAKYKKFYITIDMDVVDPAFAPAVQNPEPDGITMPTFLDILGGICDRRVTAFDVVEVTPHYDRGITAIQTAKTIFEAVSHIEKSKRTQKG